MGHRVSQQTDCNNFDNILSVGHRALFAMSKDTHPFELVTLRGGGISIRSVAHGETMHVGTDPVTESRELHVRQQCLIERGRALPSGFPFVIWDVGLGPAANAVAVLEELDGSGITAEIHSFEIDTTVLEFALRHAEELGYIKGYASAIEALLREGRCSPLPGISWVLHRGDFARSTPASLAPPPQAILFDPYSQARNPEMWNLDVFKTMRSVISPDRPCLLTNYTRSTAVRVTMLLAGWHVGRGSATGDKEETTLAASHLSLLADPLGQKWLSRVRSSANSAPLRGRIHGREPISPEDYALLESLPQFAGND